MHNRNGDQNRNRNRELVFDKIDHGIHAAHLSRQVGGTGRGAERHTGGRTDHGDRCRRTHAHALQNREQGYQEQHRETRRRRNHGHQHLTNDVSEDEHEVRLREFLQRIDADVYQGLRGPDFIHVPRKTARGHDDEADAGNLLRADRLQKVEDIKEHKTRSFDALGQKAVDAARNCRQNHDETGKKQRHVRLHPFDEHPPRDNDDEDGQPW